MNKETIHLIKGYLGYGVECEYKWVAYENSNIFTVGINILDNIIFDKGEGNYFYQYIKPILRSLEDLTDEELIELNEVLGFDYISQTSTYHIIKALVEENELTVNQAEYMYSKGIDFQDLIGQGLAIRKE